MEYFVHATRKIRQILDETGYVNNQTKEIYRLLRENWNEMKRINHQNLYDYEAMGAK